jgi:outer membrane protein W
MFKKAIISALLILATTSAAWAQSPKVEVAGLFGYSLTDGVSGDPYKAGDGNTYDRVTPKDSMMFGASFGFFVKPSVEVGFMWRHQPTSLEISGTTVKELANMNINGYHGFGMFYFGEPDSKVRPYLMGGLGATNYSGFSFATTAGTTRTVSGVTRLSSTWGAGVKVYPSPKVGFQAGIQWTPTYIKSDAVGWWCDPWFGCYVVGNAQYSNQFEFVTGLTFRF